VRIALDAMGTDRHPAVEIEGAVRAACELPNDFEIVLVGDRARIAMELARWPEAPRHRFQIVHTSQAIGPGESAASAVRRKPDSSIVVGLGLQRGGQADAFISAGSTGAVMAASLFLLRRLPGVDRPAVATILPTAAQPCLLIDAGANVDCKPSHLLQFARLGSIYVEDAWQRPSPRVGLLNIGEEPEKGNELAVEAHRLLRTSELHFIGNVEGRDIIRGVCDVLVADGFVGNVLLKFYESVTAARAGQCISGVRLHGIRRRAAARCERHHDYLSWRLASARDPQRDSCGAPGSGDAHAGPHPARSRGGRGYGQSLKPAVPLLARRAGGARAVNPRRTL
jgi:glycerol-3-phosphate acyltransferase PlsX